MGRSCVLILVLILAPTWVLASGETGSTPTTQPIDRGFGEHDACFGDKFESDDDLKTGDELTVEELLELVIRPSS